MGNQKQYKRKYKSSIIQYNCTTAFPSTFNPLLGLYPILLLPRVYYSFGSSTCGIPTESRGKIPRTVDMQNSNVQSTVVTGCSWNWCKFSELLQI